jgi:hypothetical protein
MNPFNLTLFIQIRKLLILEESVRNFYYQIQREIPSLNILIELQKYHDELLILI